jgi:hypothetical protein
VVPLVPVPDRLAPAGGPILVAAGEWLASQGGFAIWLAGASLPGVDRLATVRVRLPAGLQELDEVTDSQPEPEPAQTEVWCPPVTGRPAPGSQTEQAMEAALTDVAGAHRRGG